MLGQNSGEHVSQARSIRAGRDLHEQGAVVSHWLRVRALGIGPCESPDVRPRHKLLVKPSWNICPRSIATLDPRGA